MNEQTIGIVADETLPDQIVNQGGDVFDFKGGVEFSCILIGINVFPQFVRKLFEPCQRVSGGDALHLVVVFFVKILQRLKFDRFLAGKTHRFVANDY